MNISKSKQMNLLFISLALYIFMIFFRDAMFTYQYFVFMEPAPYHKINIANLSGPFLYVRDVSMLLWNIVWTLYLIMKYKNTIVLIGFFTVILLTGILFSGDMSSLLILTDVRIINGIYAGIGVFFITKYFIKIRKEFALYRLVQFIVALGLLAAIASIIEFSVLGWPFGYRIMGVFTNSQMNSYVLLFSVILLYLLYLFTFIQKRSFFIMLGVFVFAIITTGTRTGIVGVFVLLILFSMYFISKSKNRKLKIFTIYIIIIIVLTSLSGFIEMASSLAGRGNMLSQNIEGARLGILFQVINELTSHGAMTLLFGEGVGWGSNTAETIMGEAIPKVYRLMDGTLPYMLVRAGLFGLLILFFLITYIYKQIQNKYLFTILMVPITFTALSTNIFEIYAVLLMIGLGISFIYQQEHCEKSSITNYQTKG